jgi:ERCC4 domain/Lsr2
MVEPPECGLDLLATVNELLIATNPDPDSALAYLLRVPVGDGIVLRTAGTWPRTKALYCYPVPGDEWPAEPDIVERVPLISCVRRGAAIDIVAARSRENRSQLVFTTARGRQAVFWQSPRTRKQARPQVSLPTARAGGISELEIVVDAHERYAYRFAGQQVRTTSRGLACGDYAVVVDGAVVAAVERKSVPDLISSLTSGRLRYALGELAALPRAAVVVEDRYSQIYKPGWVRPALVADGIAECQVRWPNVAIVFCDSRGLAEEWTYRYLAAAHAWAAGEAAAAQRIGVEPPNLRPVPPPVNEPSSAEIRDWARHNGIDIADRGRIPASVRQAWQTSTANR